MREFTTGNTTMTRTDALTKGGQEPLPEPYESAARMIYGDTAHNEAFIARADFRIGSLHRWRQQPEMIARTRFLASNHHRRIQTQHDKETTPNS